MTVTRNHASEAASADSFAQLQAQIHQTFGAHSPSPPVLRCRNATQTSVVLEWDPLSLATAQCRSLAMYRDGSKIGNIPRPLETRSTKVSGLAVDTEYVFQLVLRTSAGTWLSERLRVRTHKMTDLYGIVVTAGVMPAALRESLGKAVERIGGKLIEGVRLDTTHFVCTEGKGPQWEKAVAANIPIVVPDWVLGCEREGRIVGVRGYYLNADPKLRQVGPSAPVQTAQARQHSPTPTTQVTPPTPERNEAKERTSGMEDDREESDEKPVPLPKSESAAEYQSQGATLAGEPPTEEITRSDEKEVGHEREEEEPEGAGQMSQQAPNPTSSLPIRPKATVEDAPEEESNFQDVAL